MIRSTDVQMLRVSNCESSTGLVRGFSHAHSLRFTAKLSKKPKNWHGQASPHHFDVIRFTEHRMVWSGCIIYSMRHSVDQCEKQYTAISVPGSKTPLLNDREW